MIERSHAHYYHSGGDVSFCAGSDKQVINDLRRVVSAPAIFIGEKTQGSGEIAPPPIMLNALQQVTQPNRPITPQLRAADDNVIPQLCVDSNNNLISHDAIYIDIPDAVFVPDTQLHTKAAPPVTAVPEIILTLSAEKGAPARELTTETLQSLIQRHGKNITQVVGQKLLSVGISTALREYMSRRVFPAALEQLPASVSVTLGAFALATPVALQLAGIARDSCNGRQTATSLSARLANLALMTGAITALSATVGIAVATNALLAAIFVYVPLRDIIQYFLPLRDNNPPGTSLCASASTALLYSVNQTLVAEGMGLLTAGLRPALDRDFAAICGKALVNTVGETVDEITWRRLNAQCKQNPALRLTWQVRERTEITTRTLTDQLLNTIAARAALFGTAYCVSAAAPLLPLLDSLVTGATLGSSYLPFIYTHSQSPPDTEKA